MKMRRYQEAAVRAVLEEKANGANRASLVLPTGAGKTVVFAEIIRRVIDENPLARALVIAHRGELLDQAAEKIRLITGLDVGTVKAEVDETDARIIVASVQTVQNLERFERLGRFKITVFDECHHYASPTWRAVVDRCEWFTLGVTATMSRGDGVGLGSVWPKPCYSRDILDLIRLGHLVDIEARTVAVADLDLTKVKKVAGDFGDAALAAAIAESGAVRDAVTAWHAQAKGMSTVAFCPDVATAETLSAALTASGVTAECVTGTTAPDERRAMYRRHAHGTTTVLTSCMVLTEGWDAPHATCALLLRPTKSRTLFVQMVGRVLRPWDGKDRALLLDITGAAADQSLASLVDLSETIDKTRVVPADDETLLEAIERAENEQADEEKRRREVRSCRVDLFRGSHSVWMKSRSGVWYIPAQACMVFVDEGPDGYRVARTKSQYAKGKPEYLTEALDDLEFVMSVAEEKAAEFSPTVNVTQKSAAWRRCGHPSDRQVGLLMRLYPRATEAQCRALTKGQAAEKIANYYAEKVFR
jgi:superfamily II DNA or RNA helicase